jgi:uncharacterized lipoprotein YmbA
VNKLALAMLLCGCARSSQPTFYTLSPRDGRAQSDAAGVIELRTPHVAGYLDRHALVLRVMADRLELAPHAEWAEPIDGMLARVIASDLARRLPQAQIVTEAVRAQPQLRIELDVRRFEIGANDTLLLEALVAIRQPALPDAVLLQPVALSKRVRGRDAEALVTGMSELLSELAERLAPRLGELLRPTL